MENKDGNYIRELIRILVRNLGILEKGEATCSGLTISKCHAIVEIGRVKEISLSELAVVLELDKSTMSRTINNLVEDGLAIREAHVEDRRYITITLTKNGQQVFANIESNMELYYKGIFKSIPEDKRALAIEGLELLTSAVKDNKGW